MKITKSIEKLLQEANHTGEGSLKKTLTASNLVALGVGAIIGAGLFVRTAAAAAEAAGPGVTISFIIAAIGCAFAGLCYAEFASMIPISGSAYAYSYATLGETTAWTIGWALIMEYALGATTVSIAWSEYLNNLLGGAIPYEWCHSPFESLHKVIGKENIQAFLNYNPNFSKDIANGSLILSEHTYDSLPNNLTSLVVVSHGFFNFPALIILLLITLVLIKGIEESAFINAIIVFVKIAIVLIFIAIGWQFIKPENHSPLSIPTNLPGHEGFFRHGWGGWLGGAGIVFFAFIGFDAVSTAAQEAKNPKRDMPIGIIGSLIVCTILYVLFGHVITGVANYTEFATAGKEASVSYVIKRYMVGYEWLATAVNIAILAGFSSVILVMLLGQSRVFFNMSKDGLMPRHFGELHPKHRTPYVANIVIFIFVGLLGSLLPGSIAGDLTSFGTLFAFVVVCVGIIVMRKENPSLPRPFRVPLVPLIPILGVLVCSAMIISLDRHTLIYSLVWMAIGLVIYFTYGRKHSKIRRSLANHHK